MAKKLKELFRDYESENMIRINGEEMTIKEAIEKYGEAEATGKYSLSIEFDVEPQPG